MNPVLFELDGFQFRYFSFIFSAALILVFLLLRKDLKQTDINLTRDDLFDWFVVVFFYGIIGARFYYVLFNLEFYTGPNVPWYEFLAVWHGGMAYNGAFILAPLTLYFLCRYRRLKFPVVADVVAVSILPAQALVKIGNFINGEAHGIPTESMWGVVFEYGPAAMEFPGIAIHPVMLYEAVFYLLTFFLLIALRKKKFAPGFISANYILFYSAIRFYFSFYRAEELMILGFHEGQFFATFGMILALFMILTLKLYKQLTSDMEEQFPSTRKWTI